VVNVQQLYCPYELYKNTIFGSAVANIQQGWMAMACLFVANECLYNSVVLCNVCGLLLWKERGYFHELQNRWFNRAFHYFYDCNIEVHLHLEDKRTRSIKLAHKEYSKVRFHNDAERSHHYYWARLDFREIRRLPCFNPLGFVGNQNNAFQFHEDGRGLLSVL
jgi:hypothetical protein